MTSVTEIDGSMPRLDVDLEALFTSVFDHVALAGNNVSLEMLQLAAEVYGPDFETKFDYLLHDPLAFKIRARGRNTGGTVAVAPQTRGWHPVAATELGMAQDHQSFSTEVLIRRRTISGIRHERGGGSAEANALVLTGLVHDPVPGTDKRTLALVIRGTDQVADALLRLSQLRDTLRKICPAGGGAPKLPCC